MLTIFRIIDTQTPLRTTPAQVQAAQFSALYNHLLDQGIATDVAPGEREGIAVHFEFNANAISLADLGRLFAGNDQLLAIAEEAQFHGRSLRLSKEQGVVFATLSVSEHIAVTPEILMSVSRAFAVLERLGVNPDEVTEMPLEALRSALRVPSTHQAFIDAELEKTFDYLAGICAIEHGNTEPKLAWV